MKPTSMRQVKQKLASMSPAKKRTAFHNPVSRPAENDMAAPKPALRMPINNSVPKLRAPMKQVAPRPKPQKLKNKVAPILKRRLV